VRRIGLVAQMVDPAAPGEVVPGADRAAHGGAHLRLATENYTESFTRFNFATYLRNSVVVTVAATLITLSSTAWRPSRSASTASAAAT
jgi:alpha-1,4-digalacturonate transport system permease protein